MEANVIFVERTAAEKALRLNALALILEVNNELFIRYSCTDSYFRMTRRIFYCIVNIVKHSLQDIIQIYKFLQIESANFSRRVEHLSRTL